MENRPQEHSSDREHGRVEDHAAQSAQRVQRHAVVAVVEASDEAEDQTDEHRHDTDAVHEMYPFEVRRDADMRHTCTTYYNKHKPNCQ